MGRVVAIDDPADSRRPRVSRRAGRGPRDPDPAPRRLPARRGCRSGRLRLRGRDVAPRRRPGEPRRLDHRDGAAQGDRPPAARARERRPHRAGSPSSPASTPRSTAPTRRTSAVEDDRLRLIFTCCHPALAMPARVALTLKTLGGLTTAEIARAFLVSEPTMAQRLVRAKRKIADGEHPLPGAGRRRPARPARGRALRRLPDLQRGLRGGRGRSARPRASSAARRSGSGGCCAALMPDDPEVLRPAAR